MYSPIHCHSSRDKLTGLYQYLTYYSIRWMKKSLLMSDFVVKHRNIFVSSVNTWENIKHLQVNSFLSFPDRNKKCTSTVTTINASIAHAAFYRDRYTSVNGWMIRAVAQDSAPSARDIFWRDDRPRDPGSWNPALCNDNVIGIGKHVYVCYVSAIHFILFCSDRIATYR